MTLRILQQKDAPLMLEWMHDESVVEYMGANFAEKTIDDCLRFIENSQQDEDNINLAIVDDQDQYMGTVSLKHINKAEGVAEFAITIRKCAMGKGYSAFGMKEILGIGLNEVGLDKIYWCVSQRNQRAVAFYDKNGYARIADIPEIIKNAYTKEQMLDFIWYVYE